LLEKEKPRPQRGFFSAGGTGRLTVGDRGQLERDFKAKRLGHWPVRQAGRSPQPAITPL